MKIGVAAVALNLALNVAFMVPLQHVGPALATSLAAIFNVGWLGVVLARRGHLRPDARLRRRSVRMAAAAAVMGVALWVTQHALFAHRIAWRNQGWCIGDACRGRLGDLWSNGTAAGCNGLACSWTGVSKDQTQQAVVGGAIFVILSDTGATEPGLLPGDNLPFRRRADACSFQLCRQAAKSNNCVGGISIRVQYASS